ncbi:hypothetical protein CHRY9390_01640 [Chryseobacterium aquaeductus]|uniref:Lipoprotein n=1 Tax=Chryseobacterium aquaeductus TaxID=2675056 RepID=A0A9N8MFR2_9FLAO|nr:hypothetical protein [Chryseobacterium aquaeductus]CAA7330961.1 hypothetical protein CHRY9390_01640 [Chryseobacterium potabilaquae]CAD7807318.1 hypothetical protein CHRY9390_01640 [Chryseobacterium aquaeductus]
MRKIVFLVFLTLLYSCKKEVKNPYFTSDEIYDKVLESTDIIHKEISKTDRLFYVLNRYDTLIIMSVKYENVIKPTFMIKKEGTFYTKCCKIIITEPYRPVFQIIKRTNKLKQNDVATYLDMYDGNEYQKGVMYKIKDLNHLELIAKGDLRKYFYPIKEYELIPPPPPKEYLGKPYNNKR